MSILIRCSKCHKFYGLKKSECSCGNKDKIKHYYIQHNIDGKRRNEYAGTSLLVAEKMNINYKVDKRQSRHREYIKPMTLTFGEFLDKYFIPHYTSKNKSNPKYIFDNLAIALSDKILDNITPKDIEKAVIFGSEGRSASTFNHYITTLKRIFNYAIELELMVKNPVKIKKKVADDKRSVFLTRTQADKLLNACKENQSPYLYEMVYIALYTGMRAGEIKALKSSDVRNGFIYIRSEIAKSSKGRTIPIPGHLKEFFKTASFDYNHDIKKSFDKVTKQLKMEHVRFHDLRHTYASWLVQGGTDLYQVKELLGHSSIDLTQRYAHLAPGKINISPLER